MVTPKLICVVGARPNFIKMAPIMRAIAEADQHVQQILVHTGQHYDKNLADTFFQTLSIKKPNYELHVGSGTQAWQTAQVMLRFEKVLELEKPAAVLVVGDVNSTVACALVCSKLSIPVIHVEAGLRSFDRVMPEEINRLITDQLSSMLFTTEASAKTNLMQEGIHAHNIHFVGNVMIDTLLRYKSKAPDSQATLSKTIGCSPVEYAILTLHRPSNVDDPNIFSRIMKAIMDISQDIPIIFPCHPRTKEKIKNARFDINSALNLHIIDPLDYMPMLSLLKDATLVLTDSGGLQEETTALGVPCLTLRYNTERPVTMTHGTNQVIGTETAAIKQKVKAILSHDHVFSSSMPPLWDGKAANRIAQILIPWLYQLEQYPLDEILEEVV